MNKMTQLISINKLLQLKKNDRRILLEAFILSGIFRLIVSFVPFKKYKKFIGKYNEVSSNEIESDSIYLIDKISWAVNTIEKYTPWKSTCLVKAIVAQRLLKKRSIDSTLYLGLKKEKHGTMQAHAWVRCGELIITGGENKEQFTEVAKFYLNSRKVGL